MEEQKHTPGPVTRKTIDHYKAEGFQEIIRQLEWCNYECEAGSLKNNVAFLALKEFVPELLEQLKQLKEENERLKSLIGKFDKETDQKDEVIKSLTEQVEKLKEIGHENIVLTEKAIKAINKASVLKIELDRLRER